MIPGSHLFLYYIIFVGQGPLTSSLEWVEIDCIVYECLLWQQPFGGYGSKWEGNKLNIVLIWLSIEILDDQAFKKIRICRRYLVAMSRTIDINKENDKRALKSF